MTLVALVALAGCTPGVGGRQDPAGFRGPVLIGLGLRIDGMETRGALAFDLPDGTDLDAELEVVTELGERSCPEEALDLPCPHPDDAHVDFTLAVTLDLAQAIEVHQGEGGTLPGPISQRGRERQARAFTLRLPDLAPGRHCLWATLTEDAASVVAGQFTDHSAAGAWWVTVGGTGPDHCTAGDPGAAPTASPLFPACVVPVLGPSPDGTRVRRQVASGHELFATVPACAPPAVGMLVRDGRPQLAGDLPGPLVTGAWEQDGAPVFPVGALPAGAWHLVTLQLGEGTSLGGAVSQPVLVGD